MRMLQNQTRKRGHDMGAIGIEQRWATQRMRTVWKINDNRRDAGLQYPDDVVWAENLLYGPYGNWNLLDIYYPKSAVKILDEKAHNGFHVIGSDGNRQRVQVIEKLPVIFDIHGGGWQYGDKELYRHYNIALAQHGFAVIGFNYRLAPEDCFPAAFTDVNRAMNWVAGNGEHFGLDLNRVFMVGDSAGGQMASWYATLLSSQRFRDVYLKKFPLSGNGETAAFTWEEYARQDVGDAFDPETTENIPGENMQPDETYQFNVPYDQLRLRGVALNCGIYKMRESLQGGEVDNAFVQFLGDLYESRKEDVKELVDAWNFMDENFPPAFVMTAANDFLRDCAAPLHDHLSRLGVKCELHLYGKPEQTYMGHVFHVNQKLDEAHQCNDDECEFFKGLFA